MKELRRYESIFEEREKDREANGSPEFEEDEEEEMDEAEDNEQEDEQEEEEDDTTSVNKSSLKNEVTTEEELEEYEEKEEREEEDETTEFVKKASPKKTAQRRRNSSLGNFQFQTDLLYKCYDRFIEIVIAHLHSMKNLLWPVLSGAVCNRFNTYYYLAFKRIKRITSTIVLKTNR